uniref:Galactokinase n=1 Tax=Strigamia maritima TaxID=126957 RepID=T1J9P6_STRMM
MSSSTDSFALENYNGPQKHRIIDLKSKFTTKFGKNPSFIVRAPGRVNLIGEHIDYCGYSVLPMAIEQDLVICCSTDDTNQLRLFNVNCKYPEFQCESSSVSIDKSKPNWYNYALSGYLGIIEHFKPFNPAGILMMIDGTVPPSAGLSSSSALVCAAALATLHANGLAMDKKDLAALCARSERYVGTQGGGMDQAISFLAQAGTAKLIEFNPLRTTDVQLPKDATFIIANSCSDMNKAATSHYNSRVVECRLATQIIAKKNGLDWRKYEKLSKVQVALEIPLEKMADVVSSTFHKEAYNKDEVCDILQVSSTELDELSCSANPHLERFELYKRAMHVFTEASRVQKFKEICDENPDQSIEKLGKLMNNSHESCRDLYECSHPNLDEFVEIALKSGALGSRLTGAGWGGCTVSLVPTSKVDSFLEVVKVEFYFKDPERLENIATKVFPTQPGSGAAIITL